MKFPQDRGPNDDSLLIHTQFRANHPTMRIGSRHISSETVGWFKAPCLGNGPGQTSLSAMQRSVRVRHLARHRRKALLRLGAVAASEAGRFAARIAARSRVATLDNGIRFKMYCIRIRKAPDSSLRQRLRGFFGLFNFTRLCAAFACSSASSIFAGMIVRAARAVSAGIRHPRSAQPIRRRTHLDRGASPQSRDRRAGLSCRKWRELPSGRRRRDRRRGQAESGVVPDEF